MRNPHTEVLGLHAEGYHVLSHGIYLCHVSSCQNPSNGPSSHPLGHQQSLQDPLCDACHLGPLHLGLRVFAFHDVHHYLLGHLDDDSLPCLCRGCGFWMNGGDPCLCLYLSRRDHFYHGLFCLYLYRRLDACVRTSGPCQTCDGLCPYHGHGRGVQSNGDLCLYLDVRCP